MPSPTLLRAQVRDVQCGAGVRIVEPANVYECTLGEECFVGPFVEIQRGVVIGSRTKVQSHAFVCELVTIGDDCFVGHGVMFVNDVFAIGGPDGAPAWGNTAVGTALAGSIGNASSDAARAERNNRETNSERMYKPSWRRY